MTILKDKYNLYSSVSGHEYKMFSCSSWMNHYDLLASCRYNTEEETFQFLHEKSDYVCYDV